MKSFLPVVVFTAFVTPAAAQDTDFDFSGFHFSLSASRPITSSGTSGVDFDFDFDFDVDTDGSQAITAAYLFNMGDFVVGPDLTLRRGGYSSRWRISDSEFDIDNLDFSRSGTTLSAALGVRAGYPVGRVMPFVSARIGRGTDDVDSGGSFDFDTREWGIGAEVVLRESISLLASYDRATFDFRELDFEIDSDAFSIGIGYRF